jgi:glycosyltransferase involved in cell wall biosynthesis
MNIALHSHYFVPEIGAPSARIYDLSQQWLRFGHNVQVITCFPNHPTGTLYPGYKEGLYTRESLDGIEVHRHWTYITPNKGFLKKTIGHVSYLPSAVLLSNMRLNCPQVAVGSSPTFFAAIAAAVAGIQYKIPFVMEVRDLWPAIFVDLGVLRNQMLIKILERLELTLYRKATRIVTVTKAFRHNLLERGIPAEKVHTIPNGADVDFWKPDGTSGDLGRELGLEGCFVVLYIGAHGISHALARILDAAVQLKNQPDIRFVFVGEGAEKAELLREAGELRLGNVLFHDPMDKDGVRMFYSLADVCLVPLRNIPLFDSFIPSKMFEIMAMGKPIVASLRGEAAAILEQSGSAIVVPPEDSTAVAQAVLHLHKRREEAIKMGQRGRGFVVRHYSRQYLAAKYLEILEQAVDVFGPRIEE